MHGGDAGESAGDAAQRRGQQGQSLGDAGGESHESEKRDSAKREETSLVAQRLGTRLPMQETRV